jgi:hypothetical protein
MTQILEIFLATPNFLLLLCSAAKSWPSWQQHSLAGNVMICIFAAPRSKTAVSMQKIALRRSQL